MKNNFKYFVFAAIAVTEVFLTSVCTAQTNDGKKFLGVFKINTNAIENIQFTISLSNNVLQIGSTNFLKWKLKNDSKNTVLYAAVYQSVALPVVLTNSSHSYVIIDRPRIPLGNGNVFNPPGAVSFQTNEPGKTAEWTTSFVISNDIPLDHYKLVANQFITNTNWEGHVLTSTWDVKVVK